MHRVIGLLRWRNHSLLILCAFLGTEAQAFICEVPLTLVCQDLGCVSKEVKDSPARQTALERAADQLARRFEAAVKHADDPAFAYAQLVSQQFSEVNMSYLPVGLENYEKNYLRHRIRLHGGRVFARTGTQEFAQPIFRGVFPRSTSARFRDAAGTEIIGNEKYRRFHIVDQTVGGGSTKLVLLEKRDGIFQSYSLGRSFQWLGLMHQIPGSHDYLVSARDASGVNLYLIPGDFKSPPQKIGPSGLGDVKPRMIGENTASLILEYHERRGDEDHYQYFRPRINATRVLEFERLALPADVSRVESYNSNQPLQHHFWASRDLKKIYFLDPEGLLQSAESGLSALQGWQRPRFIPVDENHLLVEESWNVERPEFSGSGGAVQLLKPRDSKLILIDLKSKIHFTLNYPIELSVGELPYATVRGIRRLSENEFQIALNTSGYNAAGQRGEGRAITQFSPGNGMELLSHRPINANDLWQETNSRQIADNVFLRQRKVFSLLDRRELNFTEGLYDKHWVNVTTSGNNFLMMKTSDLNSGLEHLGIWTQSAEGDWKRIFHDQFPKTFDDARRIEMSPIPNEAFVYVLKDQRFQLYRLFPDKVSAIVLPHLRLAAKTYHVFASREPGGPARLRIHNEDGIYIFDLPIPPKPAE